MGYEQILDDTVPFSGCSHSKVSTVQLPFDILYIIAEFIKPGHDFMFAITCKTLYNYMKIRRYQNPNPDNPDDINWVAKWHSIIPLQASVTYINYINKHYFVWDDIIIGIKTIGSERILDSNTIIISSTKNISDITLSASILKWINDPVLLTYLYLCYNNYHECIRYSAFTNKIKAHVQSTYLNSVINAKCLYNIELACISAECGNTDLANFVYSAIIDMAGDSIDAINFAIEFTMRNELIIALDWLCNKISVEELINNYHIKYDIFSYLKPLEYIVNRYGLDILGKKKRKLYKILICEKNYNGLYWIYNNKFIHDIQKVSHLYKWLFNIIRSCDNSEIRIFNWFINHNILGTKDYIIERIQHTSKLSMYNKQQFINALFRPEIIDVSQ